MGKNKQMKHENENESKENDQSIVVAIVGLVRSSIDDLV